MSIMGVKGVGNAYQAIQGTAVQGQGQATSTGFAKILGDVLSDTATAVHKNESEMRLQAMGGPVDMTQLTFDTAELANKVKMVTSVVQKVAGTWNDLTKMQI